MKEPATVDCGHIADSEAFTAFRHARKRSALTGVVAGAPEVVLTRCRGGRLSRERKVNGTPVGRPTQAILCLGLFANGVLWVRI